MCIFRDCTCNINTTILTQFVQYPNINQITLLLQLLFNFNFSYFIIIITEKICIQNKIIKQQQKLLR